MINSKKNLRAKFVGKVLQLLPFKIILRVLGYQLITNATSTLSKEEQLNLVNTIREKYQSISEEYILESFSKYKDVAILKNGEKVKGVFFLHLFLHNNEHYLYIGPIYFLSRLAFALGLLRYLERLIRSGKPLNLLGEIQNPELIIHFHTIFQEGSIFPAQNSFYCSKEVHDKLDLFVQKTPQLAQVVKESFKSEPQSTLFREKKDQAPLLQWLESHGVALRKGESLLCIMMLNQPLFNQLRFNIGYCLVDYPQYRIEYLQSLHHCSNKQ